MIASMCPNEAPGPVVRNLSHAVICNLMHEVTYHDANESKELSEGKRAVLASVIEIQDI